jgi:adenylate cyclase class 2
MAKTEQEIEVKFPIHDLPALGGRLEALGARLVVPRVHETNLRFDTPDGALTDARRVLRLRQDNHAVMTYKGPAAPGQEVSARQEIEFEVSDFTAAQHLLEALGYQVAVMYEKYRTTYAFDSLTITLDEMPFGFFAEIEGPDAASIRLAAAALRLDWEARSTASYLGLFSILRAGRDIAARNLSFAEFEGLPVSIAEMGLRYADLPAP